MFKFGKKHSEKKSDYDLTYDNLAIPEIHTGKKKNEKYFKPDSLYCPAYFLLLWSYNAFTAKICDNKISSVNNN